MNVFVIGHSVTVVFLFQNNGLCNKCQLFTGVTFMISNLSYQVLRHLDGKLGKVAIFYKKKHSFYPQSRLRTIKNYFCVIFQTFFLFPVILSVYLFVSLPIFLLVCLLPFCPLFRSYGQFVLFYC